ncbi:MAG TPA: ferritin family protein [Spirochaetota bacterium]|nr:ferritin family protein [Spirochaetota bacterium]HOL56983.1 ferritin family protein [Spirochaetota bacterium]HPP05152.1 ferritin family protein [Spirochaetota bacterium]
MYSLSEIFRFAINIEENGKKYYTNFIEKFKDDEIRQLFQFLASEEERHKSFFEKALSEIKDNQFIDGFNDEYFQYIKYFIDTIIFNKDINEVANKINSILDAIEFAKQREIDTIHYFLELKMLVKEEDHSMVDKIIKEEREHFLKLEYFKQKYLEKG